VFPEINYILSALLLLPASTQLVIANQARPADTYLFAGFLPEIGKPTYDASSAFMTVHSVMAGLVGTSSNYPPGSFISASTLNEKTAKVANHVELQEEDLRTLQGLLQNLRATGTADAVLISDVLFVILNFFDKMVLQPHLDTAEFLRGQALCRGKIDWINNGIHLEVDYHIPARNRHAVRTGNDAYGGSTSKFWEDIRFLQTVLNYSLKAIVMHPNTFNVAAGNPVNGIEIISQVNNVYKVRRIIEFTNGGQRISSDNRDTVDIILYGLEAAKIDETNPGTTVGVPFIPRGIMLGVGTPPPSRFDVGQFAVGQGSTSNPQLYVPLGYTHIAPTIEGGGNIGRWRRVFTPELKPWAVVGQGVTNMLPVIDAPAQIATTESEMPSLT